MSQKPKRKAKTKKTTPSWKKTGGLFSLSLLCSDLAVYFGFEWWTYPLVFMAFFLFVESIGKKFLGTGTGTSIFYGVFGVVTVVIFKVWMPDDLYRWEDIETPLKWILP
ncbi:hypothetical protein C4556_00705 [Candidatus Parcubacteria bacterium]|nr:MAG: hypothetical protein C4556_00705 [Candidatus Parcubacteria bacterium]